MAFQRKDAKAQRRKKNSKTLNAEPSLRCSENGSDRLLPSFLFPCVFAPWRLCVSRTLPIRLTLAGRRRNLTAGNFSVNSSLILYTRNGGLS
jgi:hypothetical protein